MLKPMLLMLWLVCTGVPAPEAQQPATQERPLLTRLQGQWTGTGKFQGQPASYHLQWEPVLEGKFVRLSLRIETKPVNGQPMIFAAQAYYPATSAEEIEARWFDSEGHQYAVKARQTGDTLTANWGEPGRVEGKSTYRLSAADNQLEVVDAVRAKDGSWREFARFALSLAGN
jgi:hypothetical protein